MNHIETLLKHQQDGTLSPQELDELNQLTHKNAVFAAAERCATKIRRRRMTGVAAAVSIILVAGTLFISHPTPTSNPSQGTIVAQNNMDAVVAPSTPLKKNHPTTNDQTLPALRPAIGDHHATIMQHDSSIIIPATPDKEWKEEVVETICPEYVDQPFVTMTPEPVVACNTQCSPDSVINDIWKFLRA